MNKRCSICNHPFSAEIDRALLTGVTYRPLAAQYGLSPSALSQRRAGIARRLILNPADRLPAYAPPRSLLFSGERRQ